jgi:hypothetical protein
MIACISEVAADEQYSTRSMANNVIKLNCNTPDTYRNIVKHCKDKGIFFHTYQLKEERAYRVVIKYLHHSTDEQDIRQELLEKGHSVRNIVNAHHRQSKEPLNIFFVDLEPAENNKDIYGITALQNKIITIEPPRTNRNHIPQCIRCQQYGHTKTYCNMPYACVKCGGPHSSLICTKKPDLPAKCALCKGNHPANYKGCDHYRNISRDYNPHRPHPSKPSPTTLGHPPYSNPPSPPQQQYRYAGNNPQRTSPTHTPYISPTRYDQPPISNTDPSQGRSYAEIIKNPEYQNPDVNTTLNNFLAEFKGLFTQLLNQNSMILSMLTTLINKTH